MNKFSSMILIFAFVCCLFSGCGKETYYEDKTSEDIVLDNTNTEATVDVSTLQSEEEMFTERDMKGEYNESDSVLIELNGDSATASSDSVKISNGTITITEAATYVISGTLTDGMIVVDADAEAKLQLVLNGVDITSKSSAALYILEADKVFVTLADGKENKMENGGTFTSIDDNNIDGTIFSKQDLTFNGSGSLMVNSSAGHGIVCKDDLVFAGGTYTVHSASHGLDANDSVRIINSTLNVDAGKDAIHAENEEDDTLGFIHIASGTIKAEAEGDGIAAGSYMHVAEGTIELLIGGGSENGSKASSESFGGFMGERDHGRMRPDGVEQDTTEEDDTSMKGLKATGNLIIDGGTFIIDSADDAIHSDTSITINDGMFDVASGDDAIHAEETLVVTAGTICITESYEGLEALNIDVRGGDITLVASDDGLNAAGGMDASGFMGGRDGMFDAPPGGAPGDMGGGMSAGNGSVLISGGNLKITASGDGIDANGTLTISGGNTIVTGPTQGDTATLDYDKTAIITGGTFIGTGASGMAQSFSDSGQGVVAINVGNQNAGTEIVLKDKDGNVIVNHAPELSFAVVIISSPEIISGETYSVTVGSVSGEFEAS